MVDNLQKLYAVPENSFQSKMKVCYKKRENVCWECKVMKPWTDSGSQISNVSLCKLQKCASWLDLYRIFQLQIVET